MKVPTVGLRGINKIMHNLYIKEKFLSCPVLCHKNIIYIVLHLLYGLCFKPTYNAFSDSLILVRHLHLPGMSVKS